MSLPFVLPTAYPLIGLGIVSGFALTLWQSSRVMAFRKSANVNYPTLYASEEEAAKDPKKKQYNCAQRAHQNTLENLPALLALTAYFGLFQPELATGALLTWVFGRIFYTVNYSTGNPAARNNGLAISAYLGLATLFFGSAYYAVKAAIKVIA